ncbi:MAG: helix-turn-helix domain-containing protein [Oscillospiraceae bacterium]|nr:helix-turn-helix domain-containing protein [Oscillospiraceae bacterium]
MEIRLGESIRRLRKGSGFTQEKLAEALGVSVSAVHKWESGKATPELEMLVDIAEFFETSVDAMLNYSWQKLSMGQAVEKLSQFATDKRLEEGIQFAEKALQRYPYSFDVVFRSAEIYSLSMDPEKAPRAIELYRNSLSLIDQNTNEQISSLTIQNRIAMCYCYIGRDDKAVELLKKNNVEGLNNYRIGLLLSKEKDHAAEALKYLSEALVYCYNELYNLCVGYANAYSAIGKLDEVTEYTLWLYELGKGIRDTSVVTWMDRGDVGLCMILAYMEALRGNQKGAYDWLAKARDSARRFDASPEYRTMVGMKFYHGSERSTAYDDMGETAMSVIENHLADEEIGNYLRPVWEKICAEE